MLSPPLHLGCVPLQTGLDGLLPPELVGMHLAPELVLGLHDLAALAHDGQEVLRLVRGSYEVPDRVFEGVLSTVLFNHIYL